MRKKSKKEQGWDKERMEHRHEVNDLMAVIRKQQEDVLKYQEQINSLKDWVRRLLEYMDLPEDVMRDMVEQGKKVSEDLKAYERIMRPFEGSMEIISPQGLFGLITKTLSGGK